MTVKFDRMETIGVAYGELPPARWLLKRGECSHLGAAREESEPLLDVKAEPIPYTARP